MRIEIKLLAFILIVLPVVSGDHVVINEVFYDPTGIDTGMEFVELYNPTEQDIDLKDYILESGDGAGPDDWTIEWTGEEEIIYANGYFLIGESSVEPTPAIITALDLQNGPDAVRLKKNQTIIDLVGYGNHDYAEYYETTPTEDISEGMSLSRIGNDTDNNLLDFSESTPNPENGAPPENMITININVLQPLIDSISAFLEDEDPTRDGIQIFPLPGKTKMIDLIVELSDDNLANESVINATIHGVTYSLTRIEQNETWQKFSVAFPMAFTDQPGNYTIDIIAASDYKHASDEIVFEYMPLIALMLDSTIININAEPNSYILAIGDNDTTTNDKTTVRNIGNVEIEVGVSGTQLSSGNRTINPENIEVALGTDFDESVVLSGDVQYFSQDFTSDSVSELSYKIFIPADTTPSIYTGALLVTVRPLQ